MVFTGWEHVSTNDIVGPHQRLAWPKTLAIGAQHIVAMFGATFLVPLITGFPPATTLLFSGVGTLLFLIITQNKLPSYLGSSFAVIAPVTAAMASDGMGSALGGIITVGVGLILVGGIVHFAGTTWIDVIMPPVVTGSIVALVGLNLAPAAHDNFVEGPVTGAITLIALIFAMAFLRGLPRRMGIFLSVVVGYVAAVGLGEVDFSAVGEADWIGLPEFNSPSVNWALIPMFLPVVLVLVAENIGHVKSVAQMTGIDYDPMMGRALAADGLATVVAGVGGGSATTTYAENIGVMAATKIYSTAAYWVAGFIAILLGLSPKVGALVQSIPPGVLGGICVALYGLIGIIGVRIWITSNVDFSLPKNQFTAAISLVLAIANFVWIRGDVTIKGIAIGAFAAILIYQIFNLGEKWFGDDTVPGDSVLEAEPATAAADSGPTTHTKIRSRTNPRITEGGHRAVAAPIRDISAQVPGTPNRSPQ
jgi:uracil-xanthine permease